MSVPCVISVQDRVRKVVLRRLLQGEPVDLPSLSRNTGLAEGDVEDTLALLHTAGAIHRADGAVVAAYPLSAVPTRHRVSIEGTTAYANCAIDALAVPFMVDAPASVASDCAHCGAAVSVQMHGARIVTAVPDAPVVFYVARECCETGPAVLTRCPHINFFCSVDHGRRWLAAHPERSGPLLTLSQAVAQAQDRFDQTILLVRSAR